MIFNSGGIFLHLSCFVSGGVLLLIFSLTLIDVKKKIPFYFFSENNWKQRYFFRPNLTLYTKTHTLPHLVLVHFFYETMKHFLLIQLNHKTKLQDNRNFILFFLSQGMIYRYWKRLTYSTFLRCCHVLGSLHVGNALRNRKNSFSAVTHHILHEGKQFLCCHSSYLTWR